MTDEHKWPDRLMLRDTQLHDDISGGGQRIYTTAGRGYERTEYIRADLASDGEKLASLRSWCRAYPVQVFPEPDWAKAQELLAAGGMTLDAISASNMRHVLNGVLEIIDQKKE